MAKTSCNGKLVYKIQTQIHPSPANNSSIRVKGKLYLILTQGGKVLSGTKLLDCKKKKHCKRKVQMKT